MSAVAYLLPQEDFSFGGSHYDFSLIEIHRGAVLVFQDEGTIVDAGDIESTYKRINVTWAPYIYEGAHFVLPPAILELRAPVDWSQYTHRRKESIACPSSMVRSSTVTIWGALDGSQSHLLIGPGGTLQMGLPSNREVGFVGITVQDSGRLIFNSHYGEADDTWVVTVSKDEGPYKRDGSVTIEGGGRLTARNLHVIAESVHIEAGGLLTLEGRAAWMAMVLDLPVPALALAMEEQEGRAGPRKGDSGIGYVYGNITEPDDFGSGIGSGVITGGGILRLDVAKSLDVEGEINVNGKSGGASGGSVWINADELEGSGTIKVGRKGNGRLKGKSGCNWWD
ncbi:Tenascin-X [Apostichopus japonicus]|uniref:Tenascin-X n=1 Tax=Stichopus japonicus TaxID=307972 RepID=A0A2G8L4G5_STIJA|nr:Tenascin-X [Apostichopus japonicus]